MSRIHINPCLYSNNDQQWKSSENSNLSLMSVNYRCKNYWYGQQVHTCTILDVKKSKTCCNHNLQWICYWLRKEIWIFLHNLKIIFESVFCTLLCSLVAHVFWYSPLVETICMKIHYHVLCHTMFEIIFVILLAISSFQSQILVT